MFKNIFLFSTMLAFTGSQAYGQDLETRTFELSDTNPNKLEVGVFFESEWHEYNNIDFRNLDESSDQAILDSDDRDAFAFTGAGIHLGYRVDSTLRFVFSGSHRGLWGNDQLGNINAFGGWLYLNALYVEYSPDLKGYQPTIRVGRQYFSLGGDGSSRDFILSDILDMVRVDLPLGKLGQLVLVPINVLSTSGDNDGADFVSYIGQSSVQTFNFRGDRMTRRHGGMLVFDNLPVPLDLRAYGFYTDIGALGSGSDISYNGLLGNFADNDWVANFGLRAAYTFGPVTAWANLDGSTGIDRKELVAKDVTTDGLAYGAGIRVDTGEGEHRVIAEVSYFDAYGPAYGEDGLLYSHGYVGMKGHHTGGLITNRYLGWHPSAYVGLFGVSDNPHETSRKSGTRVISSRLEYAPPGPVGIKAGWWYMQDTGLTFLDFGKLDTMTPPYGYSREEFAAEGRMGAEIGHEVNLTITADAGQYVQFNLNGAMFITSDFYRTEIARVAGTALGHADAPNPWAASAGMKVKF